MSQSSVTSDELLSSGHAWNGEPLTQFPEGKPVFTVMKMVIKPHSALPWHTHPVPNTAYILSGSLTIEDKSSGRKQTFQAGEAFNESVDLAHRGYTTDEQAELIIFYAGVEGAELSVPLPGEEPEY